MVNGKVYKLVSVIKPTLVYVGSTTRELKTRKTEHKARFNRYKNGKCGYCSSYKVIETRDYNIVLIEDCGDCNKEHLHKRERYWIDKLKSINKQIPSRTNKEYHEEWWEANKEKIKQQHKKYYEVNKDRIKEQMKKHYEQNKEQIKKQRRERYLKHKNINKEQV